MEKDEREDFSSRWNQQHREMQHQIKVCLDANVPWKLLRRTGSLANYTADSTPTSGLNQHLRSSSVYFAIFVPANPNISNA